MEPYRLKRWRIQSATSNVSFYTCARPGRSRGPKGKVADSVVNDWVKKFPGSVVLSLLGQKPDGTSEWVFYSFHAKGQSFQVWLDKNHKDRKIQVLEHPTCDIQKIPESALASIASDLARLFSEGKTVVIMDSGGIERTRQVCKYIGAVEGSKA